MTDSRRLTHFAIVAAVLYVVWYYLYNYVILLDGRLDKLLMLNIAQASAALLRVVGIAATAPAEVSWGPLISVKGVPAVVVGFQCDGLALYALFAGFIIAYPGRWKEKLWFVPLGILAIYLVNILRVASLVLNYLWASRATVEFNHHYTFTLIVYAFIFWLWMIWVRRFAPTLSGSQPSESSSSANAA